MNYNLKIIMRRIPEFNQLRKTNPRYSAALSSYSYRTVEHFIHDYETNGLKGKKVYDELIKQIAPEMLETESKNKDAKVVVKPLNQKYQLQRLM